MNDVTAAIEAAWEEEEQTDIEDIIEEPEELNDEPAEEPEEKVEEPEEKLEEQPAEKAEEPVEQKPQEEEISAPQSWSGLQRDNWNKIPAETRKYILQREEEAHKALTKHDEDRNFGKSLKDIANPYIPVIQSEGGTVEGAFKDLLNTAYVLRTGQPQQKAEIIRSTMQQFGIDPQMVMSNQQQPMNPMQVQQMVQQQWQTHEQKLQQQQEEQQLAELNKEIQAFSSNPENVYFNDVRETMIPLLESGQAQTLDEAYQLAIWANPNTRAALLEKQEKEQTQEKRKKVEAKKTAASSVTGSPGKTNSKKSDRNQGSVEDDVAAALAELESERI